MKKEAIPDLEEAHRLMQPVYSCLRRAERTAHEDDTPAADGIRTVMDHLDSAKGQLEDLLRPDRP
ncbi:MAG TPA: hypothetical protein VMF65_12630 [Acidimicrobiales bacterium]|nr:hypothetical protein [Acidimicrobiales bacterium]